jgi:uncharacterized protein
MEERHLDRALSEEFAGQADKIHMLKTTDRAFKSLLERNRALWLEIQKIQENVTPADDTVLEYLEKRRLSILDEISAMLGGH